MTESESTSQSRISYTVFYHASSVLVGTHSIVDLSLATFARKVASLCNAFVVHRRSHRIWQRSCRCGTPYTCRRALPALAQRRQAYLHHGGARPPAARPPPGVAGRPVCPGSECASSTRLNGRGRVPNLRPAALAISESGRGHVYAVLGTGRSACPGGSSHAALVLILRHKYGNRPRPVSARACARRRGRTNDMRRLRPSTLAVAERERGHVDRVVLASLGRPSGGLRRLLTACCIAGPAARRASSFSLAFLASASAFAASSARRASA